MKVRQMVGDAPPVSISEFQSRLWLLGPRGNEENAYIRTCLTIGTKNFKGERITFEMIVRQRSLYIMSVKRGSSSEWEKYVKGLDKWLLDGGMNEVYQSNADKFKKRYG